MSEGCLSFDNDSFYSGEFMMNQGNWIEAANCFLESAVSILASGVDSSKLGLCYYMAGSAMAHINEKEALNHQTDAIRYYRKGEQFGLVARSYEEQGLLHKKLLQFNESIVCYNRAYDYYLLNNDFDMAIRMQLSTVSMRLIFRAFDQVYDILYRAIHFHQSAYPCRHIIMDFILFYLLTNQVDHVDEFLGIFNHSGSTKKALLHRIVKYTMKSRHFNHKIYDSIDFMVLEEHTKTLIYTLDHKIQFRPVPLGRKSRS